MRSGRSKISYPLRKQVRVVCRLARKVTVRCCAEQRPEICPRMIRSAHGTPRVTRSGRTARASQRFVRIHATGLPVDRSSTCAPPLNALMRGWEQVLAHYAGVGIMPDAALIPSEAKDWAFTYSA